ncbi:hypothetical protein DRJ54_04365 [Candidatus Acetothermia bacterium]|nr:MAG: hypothetical protein DRJ54_04365 [Candidatus Acetothermia bacterium]
MNGYEGDKHDAEEVREILDVVSDRIPALLKGLRDVLYSKEAAENMANAVATFYKKLVEAGIPKEDARDMARGYMINLRDVLGSKGIGNIELDKREED